MIYTITQAAQVTGKGRSTIFRAIKEGRLSAHRGEGGGYTVDASELSRVFTLAAQRETTRDATAHHDRASETEVAVLRTRVELLTALLDRERQATAELRQVLALLPKPVPSEPKEVPRAWGALSRWLGR